MKIAAFVVEYNPFHNGHKYHLEESIKLTGATHTIAIMSGSFVQRGEPSLVDKWTKAKMAIENGIDLVIELPFIYSCQSAELFAHGAVHIMNSLNIVDYICFGSELDDIKSIDKISKILLEEPREFKEHLKRYLSKGHSFPQSRSLALIDYLQHDTLDSCQDYKNILKQSNNILAIEYLKALHRLKSKIQPICIGRVGSNYNDESLNMKFSSATAIRKAIFNSGLSSVESEIPCESFRILEKFYNQYKMFNSMENYFSILRYLITAYEPDELLNYFDVDSGLTNRIKQQLERSYDMDCLIDNISTKRYPKTRIKRILVHILNRLYRDKIIELYENPPSYIRILGSNENGFSLIRKISESSPITIINRFSDHKKYTDKYMKNFIYHEKKATDIYFLGLNKPISNMDYIISPYIKKI